MIPFTIDNAEHRLSDVLNELLSRSENRPFDVATAYFSISGCQPRPRVGGPSP